MSEPIEGWAENHPVMFSALVSLMGVSGVVFVRVRHPRLLPAESLIFVTLLFLMPTVNTLRAQRQARDLSSRNPERAAEMIRGAVFVAGLMCAVMVVLLGALLRAQR